jgi:hypothetical protein
MTEYTPEEVREEKEMSETFDKAIETKELRDIQSRMMVLVSRIKKADPLETDIWIASKYALDRDELNLLIKRLDRAQLPLGDRWRGWMKEFLDQWWG